MATPKSQRISILIIAIVLLTGTIGTYIVMGLTVNNQKIDEAALQVEYEQYLEQQKLASQLNADNSEALVGYSSRTFDVASVNKLAIEVMIEGTGEVVDATDTINASYFGWTSDGKIFDSSKKKMTDDAPIDLSLSGVISGWTEGLTGQKVGSTVRLSIPADKAYGSQESGIIPVNSPLEFIVEIHSISEQS